MVDLTKCLSSDGHFINNRYFIERYGEMPCSLSITYNEDMGLCDLELITDEMLKELVPNSESIFRIINKYTKRDNDSNLDEIERMKIKLSSGSSQIRIIANTKTYAIDTYCLEINYIRCSEEEIQKEIESIASKLPKRKEASKEAVANLVGYGDGQYYTIESKIKKVDINIEENYNDDFIPVYEDIKNFLDSRDSGLILFYGTPGTGKTSFLRYLCNNHPKDYIIIPPSLTSRLGDPDFVSFMLDNVDSVFILEDCEEILADRGVNAFNGAISNVLNMSDGLLSDIMNLKFICTFNADIRTIDPALLRKGRCYAKYEFKELCAEKVRNLNLKYDLGIDEIKPMTLAEIYNVDKTEYSEKKKQRKIGF